ncbi:MAG: hypothetical protein ACK5MT_03180 [Actinomycetales bacterium]
MRRILASAAGVALVIGLGAGSASATLVGEQGCTPGYWKQSQHFDTWEEAHPDTLLTFDHNSPNIGPFVNTTNDLNGDGAPDTFLDALNFKGGPGLEGAERNLMRAAVAAWLNAANEGLGYPDRRKDMVPAINAAIASGDRATMLALAEELDAMNNLGCPLN